MKSPDEPISGHTTRGIISKAERFVMAQIIIGHAESWCFGTSLVPYLRYAGSHSLPDFLSNLLVGQSFHEALFTPKQRQCSNVHQFQLSQNFSFFACRENVLYQLVLIRFALRS